METVGAAYLSTESAGAVVDVFGLGNSISRTLREILLNATVP